VKNLQNTFLILLIVSIMVFSTFLSLNDASSANITDQNVTNQTVAETSTASQAQAQAQANGWGQSVSISLNNTNLNLGERIADDSEWPYLAQTSVTVSGSESDWWWTTQVDKLNLYVRSDDFSDGSNSIVLNNFKYDGFSNSRLSKTAFTTNNALVRSWPLQVQSTGFLYYNYGVSDTVPANYYLKVPWGTSPGTYRTTVYYTVMMEST
jgi:hypothetical protein